MKFSLVSFSEFLLNASLYVFFFPFVILGSLCRPLYVLFNALLRPHFAHQSDAGIEWWLSEALYFLQLYSSINTVVSLSSVTRAATVT